MKINLILPAIGSTLLLAARALLAQENFGVNTSTNVAVNVSSTVATNLATSGATNAQVRKFQITLGGEQSLLPPGVKEKLKLTDQQKVELKPIEDDFAITIREYQAANQPRIDAAIEADRQARVAKDKAQIQAAHIQLQQVWAGLQSDRLAAIARVKLLLTPEQLKVLDDPKNQWPLKPVDETDALPAK